MVKTLKTEEALSEAEFTRLANNFYNSTNLVSDASRIAVDSHLVNYVMSNKESVKKKYKVAFLWICLNEPYWPFAQDMVQGARQFFLPGHDVDYFVWSDMPENSIQGMTVFPTEPIEWPFPTLLRYNLFLQQEAILKEYDYIFYCDVDMKFVNVVGDEILGEGLTAAPHPGYYLRKEYYPPYEPNKDSACYIPRPGTIINENGKRRFMPYYAAGGFQGGKSKDFIEAMHVMKDMIETDMSNQYIPIWNDESAWNKYLFEHPAKTMLTPSYVYPDSLINEYYIPLWGINYTPRLVTLTKKFTTNKEGGDFLAEILKTNRPQ